METLSVLAEARMDDDVLNGAEIEAVISGRLASDCDEAAGATRIKRLRDTLGNQLVSELLIKNIARRGYILSIDKSVIWCSRPRISSCLFLSKNIPGGAGDWSPASVGFSQRENPKSNRRA